jgi:hypothetical protein
MSFLRHREIYPSDGGPTLPGQAPAHRLDEFPAGYSLAGCSPAVPASASPTGDHFAGKLSRRTMTFHRMAICGLTGCLRCRVHFSSLRDWYRRWRNLPLAAVLAKAQVDIR